MFRVDVDAHIDETDATWEYLDEGARRFKPVLVDPGAATAPGDARPHRLWLIDGTILLKRWRDDKRTGTVKATRELLDVEHGCATWTSCASTCRCSIRPCFCMLSPLDRRSTWRCASLTIAGSPPRRRRVADGCAGWRCCRCSICSGGRRAALGEGSRRLRRVQERHRSRRPRRQRSAFLPDLRRGEPPRHADLHPQCQRTSSSPP